MAVSDYESRAQYLAAEGFLVFSDVNNQLMDFMRGLRPPQPATSHFVEHDLECKTTTPPPISNPASAGLFYSASRLREQLLGVVRGDDGSDACESFFRQFGMDKEERRTARQYCYGNGFDDPDFTWYFAPYVANTVIKQMVAEGHVSADVHKNMALSDWAEILRSPWMGSLMQQTAIAKFGAYGVMGMVWRTWEGDFVANVADHADMHKYPPITEEQTPFVIIKRSESDLPEAALAPHFKKELRAGMDNAHMSILETRGRTYGCPVARRAGTLPQQLCDNKHFERLVERGELAVSPSKQLGRIAFRQERTAIDVALDVLADRLVLYEETYGTPYVSYDNQALVHVEHRKRRRTIGQRTSKIFARFVQ